MNTNDTNASLAAGSNAGSPHRVPEFSFEVFPPQTDAGLRTLERTAAALGAVPPTFVSVTFGAGGSKTDNSLAAVDAVASSAPVAAHLTCVGQTIGEVNANVERFAERGVNRIVALRGDPPEGIDAAYSPPPGGFQSTADLVAAIKAMGPFWVAVSAYPEVHPQSADLAHDLDVLKAKVDAGADAAMTQMFFDNQLLYDYLDAVRQRNIDIPIIPGIFPIHDFDAVHRFATRCGATMPGWIGERFADAPTDEAGTFDAAVDIASTQIADLAAHGVGQVHIYTLNRPELALAVVDEVRQRAEHDRSPARTSR